MADVEEFLARCDDLIALADEVRTENPVADDFADSVEEKVKGMADWAQGNDHATPRMLEALENMENGLRRWLRY